MLLKRQLRRLGLSEQTPPDAGMWRELLASVRQAYGEAEQDRYTLERSLMISSREMQELYGGLRQSAANFSVVVENSPSMIFVYTGEGTIRFANATLLRALGYDDPAEVVGRLAQEALTYSGDRLALEDYRSRRARGEEVGQLHVRWVRSDGTLLEVDVSAAAITFDGEPAMLVFANDVTESLRQEEALRTSVERHRLLFEKSPLPITVFDTETLRIIAANEAALRLYGYAMDEFLSLRMSDLKVESEMPGMIRDMHCVHTNGVHEGREIGQAWRGVRTHRKKDGSHIQVDITGHAVRIGGRTAMLAIGVDVTEARRVETQLRQAQKMEAIGQLAGGVAHDFNNIIGVILADASWMKEQLGEGHPLAEDIDEIERVATRAASLTRQLLAFSRQQMMQPCVIGLNTLVTDLERMLRRIIGEDITFDVKLDPVLGSVRADPSQLEQVLMNLVVNARDAMPGGGRLTIQTGNAEVKGGDGRHQGDLPAGSYVVLRVTDTGCGMDEATMTRIFEPFFTTKEVGKGTGLGLATVFGIVKQSGGGVYVESVPMRGSTFSVYLPRIDARPSGATKPVRTTCGGSSERILLVEDDPDVRRVSARILKGRGYDVVTAENGTQALEMLSGMATAIDLVLTDVVMPGLDGVALAERVRERHPTMRIAFMSGYTDHDALRRYRKLGGGTLLHKPFSPDDLAEAVRSALGRAA